jgi:hypothetical protein
VQEGPAELEGDTLKFTAIPPRSQWPVKVTVVAWQWGRSIEPKLKTAQPVERTFYILQAGQSTPSDEQARKQNAPRAALWASATASAKAVANEQAISPQPAPVQPSTPGIAGSAIGFNIYKSLEMRASDLAGAEARVGNWNNIREVAVGAPVTLSTVVDKDGKVVPGMTVTISGGSTANATNTFDDKADASATSHDSRMYNGVFDQDQGNATTLEITGIRFARYDIYFYRRDDGDQRAGKFAVGDVTLYVRGGKGNPASDGRGYVRSQDTSQGKGTDIEQGNYVKFENMTGSMLKASFTAVNAGDNVQRNKVVGFQIVERK